MKNVNMKALVKLVGINPNTLRGWERRYQAVTPQRGDDGRRSYSADDVERVRYLWELVQRGHNIGNICKLSTHVLKKMLGESEAMLSLAKADTSAVDRLEAVIKALEKFDLELLNQHLQKARFQMGLLDLINQFIYPLMKQVGSLVGQSRLSISQEHLLSALLRDYLGAIHLSLSPYELSNRETSKKILMSTREGDIHEFGILISAILCNYHRYRNYYLGPNLPVNELLEAANRYRPDMILLGLMKLPKKLEVVTSKDYLAYLDQKLPKSTSLILGGNDIESVFEMKFRRSVFFMHSLVELDNILTRGL
ncbi:MAG: MerR family transcriptional regulator [Bacteriovoracaceae bacterium]|nr:MerR family transcriptional regulator [Bacteriovoracaceae bacterium]